MVQIPRKEMVPYFVKKEKKGGGKPEMYRNHAMPPIKIFFRQTVGFAAFLRGEGKKVFLPRRGKERRVSISALLKRYEECGGITLLEAFRQWPP